MSIKEKYQIRLSNRADKAKEYQNIFDPDDKLNNIINLFNMNLQNHETIQEYFYKNKRIDLENSDQTLKEFSPFSNFIEIEFEESKNFQKPFSLCNRNNHNNNYSKTIDSQSYNNSARTSVSNNLDNESPKNNSFTISKIKNHTASKYDSFVNKIPSNNSESLSKKERKYSKDESMHDMMGLDKALQKKHKRSSSNWDSNYENNKNVRRYSNNVELSGGVKKFRTSEDGFGMDVVKDHSDSDDYHYTNINDIKIYSQTYAKCNLDNENELEEGEIAFDIINNPNIEIIDKISMGITSSVNAKVKKNVDLFLPKTIKKNSRSSSSEHLSDSFEKHLGIKNRNQGIRNSEYIFKSNSITSEKIKSNTDYIHKKRDCTALKNAFNKFPQILSASYNSNYSNGKQKVTGIKPGSMSSAILDHKEYKEEISYELGTSNFDRNDSVNESENFDKKEERIENPDKSEEVTRIEYSYDEKNKIMVISTANKLSKENKNELNASEEINCNDISKELGIIALPDDSNKSLNLSSEFNKNEEAKTELSILDSKEKEDTNLIQSTFSQGIQKVSEDLVDNTVTNYEVLLSALKDNEKQDTFNENQFNSDDDNKENLKVQELSLDLNLNNVSDEDNSHLDFYNPYFYEKEKEEIELQSYLQEIEKMMRSIQLNEQTKSKMRRNYELKIPILYNKKVENRNYPIEYSYLSSIPFSSLRTKLKSPDFKLNLVLDIDSTLIWAEYLDKGMTYDVFDDDINYISPTLAGVTFPLRFKIRKNVIEFLQKVSKFCNIYFNTHGQQAYGEEIVKVLSIKTGIEFKTENIYGLKDIFNKSPPPQKTLQVFSEEEHFHSHALILDDNIRAWESKFIDNLIPSLKYQVFFNDKKFVEKQLQLLETSGKYYYTYLLAYNRSQESPDFVNKFVDENNAPLSMEYEESKKSQMSYLIELFENVYKLCVLQRINAIAALRQIKEKVLHGVDINLDYLSLENSSKQHVTEIVRLLGGNLRTKDSPSTHYVISNLKLNDFLEHKRNNANFKNNKKTYLVNLKWLFHCYFFMKKIDENDPEYRQII